MSDIVFTPLDLRLPLRSSCHVAYLIPVSTPSRGQASSEADPQTCLDPPVRIYEIFTPEWFSIKEVANAEKEMFSSRDGRLSGIAGVEIP